MHGERLGADHFARLETIRGVAAAYVVLNHARGTLWAGGNALRESGDLDSFGMAEWAVVAANQLTRCGYDFVMLFFVVSGFSIAHSLRARSDALPFYARRLVRLYPPYLLGIVWAYLVYGALRASGSEVAAEWSGRFVAWDTVVGNLLYVPWGELVPQYWSLPHELVFYGLAPLWMRNVRAYALGSTLAFVAARLVPVTEPGFFWAHFTQYNAYFAWGALTYVNAAPLRRACSRLGALRGGCVAAALFLALIAMNYRFGQTVGEEVVACALAVLAIGLVIDRPQPRWLAALGSMSYSLYLTHFATIYGVLALLVALGVPYPIVAPWVWPIAVPPALAIAAIAYAIAEMPTRAWLESRRTTSSAPVRRGP